MARAGQIVLFTFPNTDMSRGKPRPAVVIGKLPGKFDDWLICMISTQERHYTAGFDERISQSDNDFATSGLKRASIVRVGRLAVVDSSELLGWIGSISSNRLARIKSNLISWLQK